MTEKRRAERKQPTNRVMVRDTLSGELLGQLGNITPEGLMLIGDEAVREGSTFQLSLTLADPTDNTETHFNIGATSLWTMIAASGNHWSGFQIIDISEQQQEALSSLYNLM